MEKLTIQKPTSNGLDMASERATVSVTTSERTTNHGTTMEKLTTQKPTSNGPDCSGVPVRSSSYVFTIYVDNQPLGVYCEMRFWSMDGVPKKNRWFNRFLQNLAGVQTGIWEFECGFWLAYTPTDVQCEDMHTRICASNSSLEHSNRCLKPTSHWNDNLHKILSTGNYKLRVDIEDWDGEVRYAEYDTFAVGNEATNYKLTIANYDGNAGDSLIAQDAFYQPNGYGFSTLDRDNDGTTRVNCGEKEHSGWWFKMCTKGNLNGKYYNGGAIEGDGIYWEAWKLSQYSLRNVSMKIKQG